MMKFDNLSAYDPNHIRVVANNFVRKYLNLDGKHVFWIARELNIYPDAIPAKKTKSVQMTQTGKINRDCKQYVTDGKLNNAGIQAIEAYIIKEGYKINTNYEENKMSTNIWEQADLISLMKKDYEKAVAERDEAKAEATQYCELADKYEKEIEDLKDKLLIAEKENNELKSEKKELGKLQLKSIDFDKEIEGLQERIGKYNKEVNLYISDVNELRKDVSACQASVNRLLDTKKKLDSVLSDLVGCSKRLMNIKQ